MRWLYLLLLLSILAVGPAAEALKFTSDDEVSIDSPVEDDLFAGGDTVNVNAPVDSAVIAGGNVSIDAPIKGDLIVFGGDVNLNSDVGGKIVAAGGTINLRGDVARNVVMAGGQIKVFSTSEIGRDAAVIGGDVYNEGDIAGTLWVNAGNFENNGTVGDLKFKQWEEDEADEERAEAFISTFSVLIILGFLIVGLIILRLFPRSVSAVDREIMKSPPVKALLGLGLIVASIILIVVSVVTVVGMPLGFILLVLLVAALLLANLFVSFSLGRWILSALNQTQGDYVAFVLGYVVLAILFLIPFAGPIIKLISVCLGFGATIFAINESRRRV